MAGISIAERLVRRGLTFPVRVAIGVLVLSFSTAGLLKYKQLNSLLDTGVAPPIGSPSSDGRQAYQEHFPANPVLVIAHVTTIFGNESLIPEGMLESGCGLVGAGHMAADCPLSTPNETPTQMAVRQVSNELQEIVSKFHPQCDITFESFWTNLSNPEMSHLMPSWLMPKLPEIAEIAHKLLAPTLFANNYTHTMMIASIKSCSNGPGSTTQMPVDPACVRQKKPNCQPLQDLSEMMKSYAQQPRGQIQVSIMSLPDVFQAAMDGVDQTMTVSTFTAPVAFAILACVLRNVRLLIIPLVNIAACLFCTTLVMYFVASHSDVSSQAPALMLACALAMSIDYSLFLLTRFREELVNRKRPYRAAVITMLETSGHTVLVSGITLTLCFFGMLLIPVSTIASLGVASAITVIFAIIMALIFTPTILLAFPTFFTDARRYGCSGYGCACSWWWTLCDGSARARVVGKDLNDSLVAVGTTPDIGGAQMSNETVTQPLPQSPFGVVGPGQIHDHAVSTIPQASAQPDFVENAAARSRRGCWPNVGAFVQKWWAAPLVGLALIGIAVPFVIKLTDFEFVEGVIPLLPRDGETTNSFVSLQDTFGVSTIFSNTLVIVPENKSAVYDPSWFNSSCMFLTAVASDVSSAMSAYYKSSNRPDCSAEPPGLACMSLKNFGGIMAVGGKCAIEYLDELHRGKVFEAKVINTLLNATNYNKALKVSVTTAVDPFGVDGREWIRAMREAINGNIRPGLEQVFFTGIAQEQMDGSEETFKSLPTVVFATLGIVFLVLLVSFRSLLVPMRAAICLVWMLVVTFGSALCVYQGGVLEGWGLGFLQPSGDALFWMSPCISFSIVVGLGLDYDIFLMESVVEFWDNGASAKQAVVMALESTGNIICLAGVIMTLAFAALLLGSSPALNQIGFLLIIGVLVDCFITTKVIIPCAMAFLPYDSNFWPRRRPARAVKSRVTSPVGALSTSLRDATEDEATWEPAD